VPSVKFLVDGFEKSLIWRRTFYNYPLKESQVITNRKGEMMLKKAEDISQFWAYDSTFSKNSDITLLDNIQGIY
jgi:hypothetical protein